MLLIALLGFMAVGLSLGLLGGGGSILAVPVLVHVMGIPPNVAVPMSLPIVGCAAAFGAAARWRTGQLRLRLAAPFAVVAIGASFAAARLGLGLPGRPRMVVFAITMLSAALAMWRRASREGGDPSGPPRPLIQVVPAALAVGTLTGLVGVGGGFLIVPALTGVLGMPMAQATATSLAVIALNCASAGYGYLGHVQLDLQQTALVTAASLVGMVIGTRLAPHIAARTLTRAFAVLLVVLAGFMLWRELGA